jgi:hypothetical protein
MLCTAPLLGTDCHELVLGTDLLVRPDDANRTARLGSVIDAQPAHSQEIAYTGFDNPAGGRRRPQTPPPLLGAVSDRLGPTAIVRLGNPCGCPWGNATPIREEEPLRSQSKRLS